MFECKCGSSSVSFSAYDRFRNEGWHLPSSSCPCRGTFHFTSMLMVLLEELVLYRVSDLGSSSRMLQALCLQ